ncbi:MAG: Fpg/Nei family DNA glycosylase [Actinobacteria bacterium]|nr:Fpg/Nei family DNA glycosylase [Actinomycetota bacterium]
MPELPELQALAERLDDALSGTTLRSLDVLQFSALKTVVPSPFDLTGNELASVGRRGKYISFDFGVARALVHLSQGGRVDIEDPPKKTRPKGAVVRLVFDGAPSVLVKEYGTERKAACWVVEPDAEGPLEGLGPEPDTAEFEAVVVSGDDGRQLHTFLRDQKVVAGIGRGFADDILHAARLSPFGALAKLDDSERRRLYDSTTTVLEEATERERERAGGLPAKMGDRFTIHNRHGQACPRCGDTMRRVSFNSREITYCPACQTSGKVLADRRMSRLLR